MWRRFIIWCVAITITMNIATNTALLVDSEGKARPEGLDICSWPGITCDLFGRITKITPPTTYTWMGSRDYRKLNFSLLPDLIHLDLSLQRLNGSISAQLCTLSNLEYLDLSRNTLSGELPRCLANLTKLVFLDMSFNDLNGSIPSSFGQLSNLQYLNLSSNKICGSIPSEIGQLKDLVFLSLKYNNLVGQMPSSLGQLRNLTFLLLNSNSFNSSIPQEIGELENLVYINLSNNKLVGSIPCSLGQLRNLTHFRLGNNKITSLIPPEITKLKKLVYLDLCFNSLIGPIPSSIGQLTNLERLLLQHNQINGSIPPAIGNLKNLTFLSLSTNNITGPIPLTIGNLLNMKDLTLDYNQISGFIPAELGKLHNLKSLSIRSNKLIGPIPLTMLIPPTLRTLDLSYNNLSGAIPCSLRGSSPPYLVVHLNYNNFSKVDLEACYTNKGNTSFQSHPSTRIHSVHNKGVNYYIKIFLPITICFVLVLGILLCHYHGAKKIKSEPKARKNGDVFSIWNYDGKIAYEDIIAATDDFDIRYCIGTGGYGSVYKAHLPNGKVVALKKLHRLEAEEPAFDKSFRNEVKILSEVRHRNIVKLYGFCLHNRCMFLVYEYLERGSLFYVLRIDAEAMELNWKKE